MAKAIASSSGGEAARPERQPLYRGTTVALALAFISFVIPIVPAILAIPVALVSRYRLRRSGGDRMNEGLAMLAIITAVFTLSIYGAYIWWAE